MTKRRGHGEGSIYKRNDGRWETRISLGWKDGKRDRKVLYGRTRREVADKLAAALKAVQAGEPLADQRTTVEQFLASWLPSVEPTLRPATWRRYEQYARLHVVPQLGRRRLATLDPQHLQRLYADRLAAGLSPQTVVHLHRFVHRALGQAMRWSLVPRNVADLVDPPRVDRHEVTALTPDQAHRFLDAARGDRLEALYVLALYTGMRQGELLGLRWVDVEERNRALRVRRSLQVGKDGRWVLGEPKTQSSRRPILLTAGALAALGRHREHQAAEREWMGETWQDHGLVFTDGLGGPLRPQNLIRRSFVPLLERAGVPRVRFHDLRHTVATLLLEEGVHPKVVGALLGHSAIAVTVDLYSHVTATMQAQAVDTLDRVLGSQNGSQGLGS